MMARLPHARQGNWFHLSKPITKVQLVLVLAISSVLLSINPVVAEDIEAEMRIELEGNTFSIFGGKGEDPELITVQDTDAEDLLVGFMQNHGPFYVRTVNHFYGEQEKPLFDINNETAVTAADYADPAEDGIDHTFTPLAELPRVESSDFTLGTVIVVGADSASLAWNAPEGTQDVEVFLNDKPVQNDIDGVELNNLKPNSVYEVSVSYRDSVSVEGGVSIREDLHLIHTLPPVIGNPTTNRKEARKIATLASSYEAKAVRFVTFLKNDFYPAGWMSTVGCATPHTWFFKGDGRSYSRPSGPTLIYSHPSFRTGLDVIADLDAPPAYQGVHEVKDTGITRRYNESKRYVDQDKASTAGMVVQNPTASAYNYVKFGVSHEVGDPFCWIGKIRYALPLVEIFKSGTVSLSGSRQPIPTFEFYASFSTPSGSTYWANLYRKDEGDLICLLGACPSQNIKKTYTAR